MHDDGRNPHRGFALRARCRNAALWQTPRSPLLLILSVEAVCVTWLITANVYESASVAAYVRFGLLCTGALLYLECNERVERLRQYLVGRGDTVLADASALWFFCAALILPPGLAGAFGVVYYLHAICYAYRARGLVLFKLIYSAAAAIVAVLASSTFISNVGGGSALSGAELSSLVAVLGGMAIFVAVDQGLVVGVAYLVRRPVPVRAIMGGYDEQLTEFATLSLAVLLAVTVVHAPLLSPFTLILIVVLRRSALVRQLQEQALRDAKTGLLNAGAWRQEAEREIVRGERVGTEISVLMIDLDHFKQLNDEHGHPAGDTALQAVAACLREALRGYDAIGRFGGEEFIALLADAEHEVSVAVAERLRTRIEALELPHGGRVTASIGVGVGTADVHTLDELISLADKALYAAKHSGRNRVRLNIAAPVVQRLPRPPVA